MAPQNNVWNGWRKDSALVIWTTATLSACHIVTCKTNNKQIMQEGHINNVSLLPLYKKEIPNMLTEDTICAISTAPGKGGIAIARVSGKEAITITDRLFRAARPGKTDPGSQPDSWPMATLWIPDGKVIDTVLVSVFRAPHSFYRRGFYRDFVSWFTLYTATDITATHWLRMPNGSAWRIYQTRLHEWQDGPKPSRGGGRPYRLQLGSISSMLPWIRWEEAFLVNWPTSGHLCSNSCR